jgi:nitrate/nitrite transporter NarK
LSEDGVSERQKLERVMFIGCLIIAGEAVFSLPFHVARFFRPTVLHVFEFTNTELGAVQAVYGVVAMLAYFPGGPLADRFPARRLLTGSLLSTSLGGFYFATFPAYQGMWLLFAYWGLTTILLFWAALIRATREWGGHDEQGRAYGILDGGRGLWAAVAAAAAVLLFEAILPEDPTTATVGQRAEALRGVILMYTAVTAGAGLLCWFFVPEREALAGKRPSPFRNIATVARLPAVWLQALIVVSAYVGYKGIDNYSLFAVQAYGMNEVEGAKVTAISAWVRPVAAVGAGLLGDRFTSSRISALCFAAMVGSYLWFGLTEPVPSMPWILYANVLVTCAAVFGLRGIYFALFEEAAVPIGATGTAVGLVSVIGYTPDVFVALAAGWLLDRSPGVTGHQHFFLFLSTFAAVGLLASLLFRREVRSRVEPQVSS